MKVWECKIGEVDPEKVPPGGDGPMRHAVEKAFLDLTGEEPQACFSGWGSEFTAHERAIAEGYPATFKDIHPDLKRDAAEEMYHFMVCVWPVIQAMAMEDPTWLKLKYGVDPVMLSNQYWRARNKADGK